MVRSTGIKLVDSEKSIISKMASFIVSYFVLNKVKPL